VQDDPNWEDPELLPVASARAQQEAARQKTEKAAAAKPKKEKTKKKKSHGHLLPIIISLVVVVAAVIILAKTVVPAFQSGILSSQGETQEDQQQEEGQDVTIDTAESVALDKETATLTEAGATLTLTPTFTPADGTAQLTWTSSDSSVATVDENGTVTAVATGTATITAAMENEQKAECVVTCQIGDPEPEKVALSDKEISLSAQGSSKQLQVENASGTVKWSSDKPSVATVGSDGTVTAVSKGTTTITAEVDGETLTCDVRCIW
jgi:uncharacterized protein YjdB